MRPPARLKRVHRATHKALQAQRAQPRFWMNVAVTLCGPRFSGTSDTEAGIDRVGTVRRIGIFAKSSAPPSRRKMRSPSIDSSTWMLALDAAHDLQVVSGRKLSETRTPIQRERVLHLQAADGPEW